jgi:hypothetical protein
MIHVGGSNQRSKRRHRPPGPTEEELEVNDSSGLEPQTTTSGSQNKRKRGQHGRTQYLEGQWTINTVSIAREPIEPPEVSAKFQNAMGSIIRTKMVLDPSIPDWLTVPEGKKEARWQLLSKTFIFPRGTKDKVKHYARKMLGESFRRWKSDPNTKYVQKGRTPFAGYRDITLA